MREVDPDYKPTKGSKIFLWTCSSVAVALVVIAIALMCSPAKQSDVPQQYKPYIGGITLTFNNMPIQNSTVTVEQGTNTERITVLVDAYGMRSGGVEYVSSNEDILTVDANGVITAKAAGECAVTVTVNADKSVYEVVLVRVVPAEITE